MSKKWPEIVFSIVGILLLFRLFALSIPASSDFEVYWYAARAWIDGLDPYAHYSYTYPGLVYKYPPWTLPAFLPFAWVSLTLSKWSWLIGEIAAFGFILYWLGKNGVKTRVATAVALLFWFVWLSHCYFGQVTLFMTAYALWVTPTLTQSPASPSTFKEDFQLALLIYILSFKIFSLFALIGVWKKLLRKRIAGLFFSLVAASHLILVFMSPFWRNQFFTNPKGFWIDHYRKFIEASASGGTELGVIRGAENHGFSKVVLNLLGIGQTQVTYDIGVAFVLIFIFGFLWNRFSKNLDRVQRWVGFLGISVIAHPLAWNHSFIMAYPLCVFSLQKSLDSKRKALIAVSLLGIFSIGLLIPQIVGVDGVRPFEEMANKSWGVVLACAALVLSQSKPKSKSQPHKLNFH